MEVLKMEEICEICERRIGDVNVVDTEGFEHGICVWCEWVMECQLERPKVYSRSVRKEVEI